MSVQGKSWSLMLLMVSRRCLARQHTRRSASTASAPSSHEVPQRNQMHAWQVHSFGGTDQLNLSESVRIPLLAGPNDVLVQVSATSVNPIDVAMLGGYGNAMLNLARNAEERICRNATSHLDFPLILGRDFVGEVVECGAQVKDCRVGDRVWGVVPPFRQGAHAQYALASACHITKAPSDVSDVLASGVPYAGLSAWSSLWAPFAEHVWPKTRVLVLGGSGGVGSLAVQMLKAWGSQVVTTCKTDAVPTLESFGLDGVIDYTSPDYERDIKMSGPYDVILNAAGLPGTPHFDSLKEWRLARYVTLSPPLLSNADQYGVPLGAFKSWMDISKKNIESITAKGAIVQWGFFTPNKSWLQGLAKLVADGKVRPLVHETHKFSELPLAYESQLSGHVRGKIVVEMDM